MWEVAAAPLAAPPPTSKQHQHHHPHHQLRVWAACGLQSWVASCGRVQLRAWATGGRGCAHRYNAGWQPDGEGEGGAESQPLREAGPETGGPRDGPSATEGRGREWGGEGAQGGEARAAGAVGKQRGSAGSGGRGGGRGRRRRRAGAGLRTGRACHCWWTP